MTTLALPEYAEVKTALENADSPYEAAQVHGLFCGLICGASVNKKVPAWKKLILAQKNLLKQLKF